MTTERIGFKEKVAYGFGDAASSMFWKLFSMYLMFYYTDVFGISAVAVAAFFSLVFSASSMSQKFGWAIGGSLVHQIPLDLSERRGKDSENA
jgi:Na+/melibiose symporter-like transporter